MQSILAYIMADNVTSYNSEQLALCVRFVDQSSNIREEFISFSDVPRITGEHLACEILQVSHARCSPVITNLGLNISNIHRQGYDRLSSMASARVGVQAHIQEYAH